MAFACHFYHHIMIKYCVLNFCLQASGAQLGYNYRGYSPLQQSRQCPVNTHHPAYVATKASAQRCVLTLARTGQSWSRERTGGGGGGFRPPSNVFIWQRIHKCDIPFCSSRRALSKRIKKFTFPVTWLGDNREKPYKNGIFWKYCIYSATKSLKDVYKTLPLFKTVVHTILH